MNQRAALMRRIHAELIDGYDEELELEIVVAAGGVATIVQPA